MAELSEDWADGFLVVGNHPALDLLNTSIRVDDKLKELLPDTSALVRWLLVSELGAVPGIKTRLRDWSQTPEAKAFLEALLIFREKLREAVLRMENGKQPTAAFLADLNAGLLDHPIRRAVISAEGKLQSAQALGSSVTDTLWSALLNATADLLTDMERARLRKCETCVVHFYDTSKKNARRWCSMKLCGNRVKVRAYKARNLSTIG